MLLLVSLEKVVFSLVRKKKFFPTFLFILFVMFFGFTYDNSCNASDESDYQLNATQFSLICETVGATQISGDALLTFLDTFNQWMRTMEARSNFSWEDYDIFFFYASTNAINWVLNSNIGTPDIYWNSLNSTTTSVYLYGFNSWNYDANNNITGFNSKSITRYTISYYSPNQVASSNITNQNINVSTGGFSIVRNTVGSYDVSSTTNKYLVWEPHWIKKGYTSIYGYNTDLAIGYNDFRLTNTLGGGSSPTPTPSPTPTSGGGGSVDLSTTNSLISSTITAIRSGDEAILDTLTDDPEMADIGSGDVTSALGFQPMNDPYSNVWLHLTNGLRSALLDTNRSISGDFLGVPYVIDLDVVGFRIPTQLRWLFATLSTCAVVWVIVKYWHKIAHKLQSGDIDDILLSAQEEGIINLF